MSNTTKRLTGTAQTPYKWSDPVYTGKKSAHQAKPARKSYHGKNRTDKSRIMMYVDLLALMILGAVVIVSFIQAGSKHDRNEAQLQEQVRLEEQIEARRQELDKNTSYEIIARLSYEYGFRDSNELARIDLRVPNRRSVETASR